MRKLVLLATAILSVPAILLGQGRIGDPQKLETDAKALPVYKVVCPVIKDTWIYSFRPDSNYGLGSGWKDKTDPEKDLAVPKLFLGFGGNDKKVILAQFDLTKLPKGKVPLKAVVRFYNDYAGSAAETKVDLRMVSGPWDEMKVTWKKRPKWTSIALSTVTLKGGIDYNQPGKWYEWDAAKLIDIWVLKKKPNYGIALEPQGSSGVDRDFICREYNGKQEYYPVLEVTYKKEQPSEKNLPKKNQ
jgi:hypothetical protein